MWRGGVRSASIASPENLELLTDKKVPNEVAEPEIGESVVWG